MMHHHVIRWLRLATGVALLTLFIAATHLLATRSPGPMGRVWAHNAERSINASALFYTELGDVRDFTDRRRGRYSGWDGDR